MGVVDRRGLTLGFSLGLGGFSFECDGCDDSAYGGGALDFHIGGMLNQRLGIMFDGWGVSHLLDEDESVTHVVATGGIQYWLGTHLWIKGALGFGQLSYEFQGYTEAVSDTGLALAAAGGLEILQAPHFTLDLQLRISTTAYEDTAVHMFGLTIGANWY
jgi:hypothetical protein